MPAWLRELIERLARQCAFIIGHFIVAMLFVLLGFFAHHLLAAMGDPKLFNVVPWGYVVDFADVPVVLIFVVMGLYEAVRVFRE